MSVSEILIGPPDAATVTLAPRVGDMVLQPDPNVGGSAVMLAGGFGVDVSGAYFDTSQPTVGEAALFSVDGSGRVALNAGAVRVGMRRAVRRMAAARHPAGPYAAYLALAAAAEARRVGA